MRVQRTRSSPSALRSPLTRHPLGNREAVVVLLTALSAFVCACPPVGDGGVSAKGEVTDSAGKPIPGAQVAFLCSSRDRYPRLFETRTDEQGRFELSSTVAPGRYTIPIRIQADGFKPAELPLRTLVANVVYASLAAVDSQKTSRISLKGSGK